MDSDPKLPTELAAKPARPRATRRAPGDEAGARDGLAHYVGRIAHIPVLPREELGRRVEAMRSHELDFRHLLLSLPEAAALVVGRWKQLAGARRVTGSLAAGHRDGSGRDWNAHVDVHLAQVEALLVERDGSRSVGEATARVDREITRQLLELDLELQVLREIHADLCRAGTNEIAPEPSLRVRLDLAGKALASLDAMKRSVVQHNLRLVVKVAGRYRHLGVPYLDLIQEGNLGLIRAVEKFEPERGHQFSTYAVWWIAQAMIRAIQNHSRTVRVPSHVYDHQLRYRRAEERLTRWLGRSPSRDELAAELEMEPELVDQVRTTMLPVASTSDPVPGVEDLTLEGRLADESAPDPVDEMDRGALSRVIAGGLASLEPRDRQILEWRFGLGGEEPESFAVIARRIGLSRERVRQLAARAMRRLAEDPAVGRLRAPDSEAA